MAGLLLCNKIHAKSMRPCAILSRFVNFMSLQHLPCHFHQFEFQCGNKAFYWIFTNVQLPQQRKIFIAKNRSYGIVIFHHASGEPRKVHLHYLTYIRRFFYLKIIDYFFSTCAYEYLFLFHI